MPVFVASSRIVWLRFCDPFESAAKEAAAVADDRAVLSGVGLAEGGRGLCLRDHPTAAAAEAEASLGRPREG